METEKAAQKEGAGGSCPIPSDAIEQKKGHCVSAAAQRET